MSAIKQVITMDDAGDAGFKFKRGSSRYLVFACVVFDDPIDAELASASIKAFRRSLGWKDSHEFKFNKNRQKDKLAFLQEARKYDFGIRAVVADKTQITDASLKNDSEAFYLSVIRDVLVRFEDRMESAKVIIDGDDIKEQTQDVRTYLRQALNTDRQRMSKFTPSDSVKEGLVQLADIIAGSIYRSLQPDKTDYNSYLPIISSKIEDLWHCP